MNGVEKSRESGKSLINIMKNRPDKSSQNSEYSLPTWTHCLYEER